MTNKSPRKPRDSQSDRPDVRLLALYRPDIAASLSDQGMPAFRRGQVLRHMFDRPGDPFADATALPQALRSSLETLGASTLAVADSASSTDGTTKLLLETKDGLFIEAVAMRYRDRVTGCISSQVGCAVGCAFCATGSLGFKRNLTAAEIVDQARALSALLQEEDRRLSNIVYMGMGEPLLNLRSVFDSIHILTDPHGPDIAQRALSVSTIGIPAGILRLARSHPQVNLALSLHAADDRTRARLIPERFLHPIATILEAAWEHFDLTRRKQLVEYVLLGGINDSRDDARRLAGLLRGHVVTVNLLPWNPVPGLDLHPVRPHRARTGRSAGQRRPGQKTRPGVTRPFEEPSAKTVAIFRDTLREAGIEAVVRQSKGADIQAACGQLAARAARTRRRTT